MSDQKQERPWNRGDMAKATLGIGSLLFAVVCVGFGRMESAAWFALAAVAFGASLLVGRRWP